MAGVTSCGFLFSATKIVKYLCHPGTVRSEMHVKSLRIQNFTITMYFGEIWLQKVSKALLFFMTLKMTKFQLAVKWIWQT